MSNEGGLSTIKAAIKVTLREMPADSRVRIFLRDGGPYPIWAMGDACADLVGIAIETPSRSTLLKLNSFVINRRELMFSTYAACEEISLVIYIQSADAIFRGFVDLPLRSSATFESEVDRTSLLGFSSFALSLSE
jgi:hypothetical protein